MASHWSVSVSAICALIFKTRPDEAQKQHHAADNASGGDIMSLGTWNNQSFRGIVWHLGKWVLSFWLKFCTMHMSLQSAGGLFRDWKQGETSLMLFKGNKQTSNSSLTDMICLMIFVLIKEYVMVSFMRLEFLTRGVKWVLKSLNILAFLISPESPSGFWMGF